MRLIIHDLKGDEFKKLCPNEVKDLIVVSDDGSIHHCMGCFGCWIKTPGECIIKDKYENMGECLSKCNEVIIISKCVYGGLSPFVKKANFLVPKGLPGLETTNIKDITTPTFYN